ncbi:MAG: acyl carrier protein, partial [Candidatus Omnitrophica bacterium]|nr:acyl carrier protein [Candidatus Omnitrophota bacterium]
GIEPDKIKPESLLVDDLGIDSFSAIEIIYAIEETFKIDIPGGAFKNVERFSDIVNYIDKRLKSKK